MEALEPYLQFYADLITFTEASSCLLVFAFFGFSFRLECFSESFGYWLVSQIFGGHPLSMCALFSEKLTFLIPWYAHVLARIKGLKMLVLRKILRKYLMDDPLTWPFWRILQIFWEIVWTDHVGTWINFIASGHKMVKYTLKILSNRC